MKYRVTVDFFFEKQADAQKVVGELQLQLPKVRNAATEKSFISFEKCYHDEQPSKPCEPIAKFEK